jgi:4'-phosphopantetheinyl transferase
MKALLDHMGATTCPAPTPAPATLRDDEVDIWRVMLDQQPTDVVEILGAVLSADEVGRAAKFYFDRDRRRFVIARGILRMLLAPYAGVRPEELAFRYGPSGKPELASPAPGPLFFNLAHSDDLALYAITRVGEVGVDVERTREVPDWEHIAALCFSPGEIERLRDVSDENRREEFFRAWTHQEAILKALGTGLGSTPPPLSRDQPGDAAFKVYDFHPAPGYAAALAIGSEARWATCRTWRYQPSFSCPPAPRRSRRARLECFSAAGPVFL